MTNLTSELDEKSELLYSYLYGNVEQKIILYVTLFLTSVIGPILCFGIIIFEKFGGDSQKRPVVNMILSAALLNFSMMGVMMGILRVTRDIFGILDFHYVVIIILLIQRVFKFAVVIFYTLLTITQYLHVVIWKRMRGVKDKFWWAFLNSSTYLVSFMVVCFTICGGITPHRIDFITFYKERKQNETIIGR